MWSCRSRLTWEDETEIVFLPISVTMWHLSTLSLPSAASDTGTSVFTPKDPSLLPQHTLSPRAVAGASPLNQLMVPAWFSKEDFQKKPFHVFSSFWSTSFMLLCYPPLSPSEHSPLPWYQQNTWQWLSCLVKYMPLPFQLTYCDWCWDMRWSSKQNLDTSTNGSWFPWCIPLVHCSIWVVFCLGFGVGFFWFGGVVCFRLLGFFFFGVGGGGWGETKHLFLFPDFEDFEIESSKRNTQFHCWKYDSTEKFQSKWDTTSAWSSTTPVGQQPPHKTGINHHHSDLLLFSTYNI